MVLRHKNNSINKIGSRKFTSPCEHYLPNSTFSSIISNTRRHSYDLNFKLKIVAEAEADSKGIWNFRINGSEVAQSAGRLVFRL